jgi:hypothetical protein
MAISENPLRKIRCFVIGRRLGLPLPRVTVALAIETDSGLPVPAGLLMSDTCGYVSFDIGDLEVPGGIKAVWLIPVSEPESRINILDRIDGRRALPSSTDGPRTRYARARPSTSVANDNASSGPFMILVDDGATGGAGVESCGGFALPSIQNPDPCDYKLSPKSFVNVRSLRLGEGCCEDLVPATVPVQEYTLSRVVVRGDGHPMSGERPRDTWFARWSDALGDSSADLLVDVVRAPASPPPAIKFGEVLDFRQRWFSLGHSLGEIKYSLALAPGEAVDIAVIDWSRSDDASRTDSVTATERLRNRESRDRTITDTVEGTLTESQEGSSFMAGHAGAMSIEYGNYKATPNHSLGGGIARSSGNRSLDAESTQKIHDLVRQRTWSMRDLNSTVIVQANQGEKNALQTRRVANHNHCHALTIEYYEVLRHYRLATEFAGRRKAVLIPFRPFAFDWSSVVQFETYLREGLLDPSLADCFEAVARLHFGSDLYDLPQPDEDHDHDPGETPPNPYFAGTFDATVRGEKVYDSGRDIQEGSRLRLTAEGRVKFSRGDLGSGFDADGYPRAGSSQVYAPGKNENSLVCRIGDKWYQGGVNTEFVAESSGRLVLQANDTKGMLDDNSGQWDVSVEVIAPAPDPEPDDEPGDAKPKHAAGAPTKEWDQYCESRLLHHLNGNRGYYNRLVWVSLDPSDRRMMIEAALADFPQLAESIDDVPLAVSGNYVAFGYDGPVPGEGDSNGPLAEPVLPVESIVTLPTRGVFAEAMLGHCNACEKRDMMRMWDWRVMTAEETPEITDVKPGPRGETPGVTPAALPQNVIQIAQPLAAPDPTGLGQALEVLRTPNAFRDMSGLGEVSALLKTLAEGAVSSLEGAQKVASQAREKVEEIQQQGGSQNGNGGSSNGNGGSRGGESVPSAVSASDFADRLSLVPEIKSLAKDLGLDEQETKDFTFDQMYGTRPRSNPGRNPQVPQAKADEVQIAIRVIDAWDRQADADITCVITDDAAGLVGTLTTGVRPGALVQRADTLGFLPPLKGLTHGVLDVNVKMLSDTYDGMSSSVVDLNGAAVPYRFSNGTRFATFYAQQAYDEVKVTVNAGESLANKVGSALGGTLSVGAEIKIVEASLEGRYDRHWEDEFNRTQGTTKEFTLRVPLPKLTVTQRTPAP